VCKAAGFKIPLIALTWAYEEKHRDRINFERALSYITALSNKWLSPDEQRILKEKQKAWMLMGSKSGNRKRLLTRAQILAAFAPEQNGDKKAA
jgi:hypothetical protein